jgi:hypothetical protein
LVALEIAFERMFEAFHRMLQAKADAAAVRDDKALLKKPDRALLVKKMLAPK